MPKIDEYQLSISKDLSEPKGELIFRQQTNDWRDVESAFQRLTEQAKRVSQQDDRFLYSEWNILHQRMTIIELNEELTDGQDLSIAMYYQQEINEAFFFVNVLDEGIRLKTTWLPSGLMVAVPQDDESILQFEPCLIGEDFVERVIRYMDHQREVLEASLEMMGDPVYSFNDILFNSQ